MAVMSQLPYVHECVYLRAIRDLTWHGGQAVASSTLSPEPCPPGLVKHRQGGVWLNVMIIDTHSVHFNSRRHTSAPFTLYKYECCHRRLQYYLDLKSICFLFPAALLNLQHNKEMFFASCEFID